jgi:hypothetical protein
MDQEYTTADGPHARSLHRQPDLIWGAEEIAREFGLTERQFYHLAAKKLLPGVEQFGRRYVANRRRIRAIGA